MKKNNTISINCCCFVCSLGARQAMASSTTPLMGEHGARSFSQEDLAIRRWTPLIGCIVVMIPAFGKRLQRQSC